MAMKNEKGRSSYNKNRDSSGEGRGGGFKMRRAKRKVCNFCMDKVESIDYKDIQRLRRFISERGKILPRRVSGTCAKHQRQLTIAIKRSRHVALLPFSTE